MIPDYEVSVLSGDIGLEQKEVQDNGWHDGRFRLRLQRIGSDRHDPQPGDHDRRDRRDRVAGDLAGSQAGLGRWGAAGGSWAESRPALAPRDPADSLRQRRNHPRTVPEDAVRSELRHWPRSRPGPTWRPERDAGWRENHDGSGNGGRGAGPAG